MLTGTLPPRRSFASNDEEIPERLGSKEDDITKSESSSGASQKSPERSQEAAPSTLMAEDQRGPREHASAADADPDLEDASKTLVLFSPGDTRKSPSGADHVLDGELATPCTLTSHNDQAVQMEACEAGRLSPALRSDLKPTPPIAPASPPFTKVERTFIHIAETSHLNIMPSNGHIRDGNREVAKSPALDCSCEVDVGVKVQEHPDASVPEISLPAEKHLSKKNGPVSVTEFSEPIQEPKAPAEDQNDFPQDPEKYQLTSEKSSTLHPTRQESRQESRSRIPVLLLEEKSGSEESASFSARTRLQRRTGNVDLARFLVQKQQSRWMRRRIPSGASSLSSGDDEQRRASSSEEDTHISQESRKSVCVQVTETPKQSSKETKSRIPRPVTSFKRSPAAVAPLPVAESNPTKHALSLING